MKLIRITTIQAPNADESVADIAKYLQTVLGNQVEFVNDIPWQARDAGLDSMQIDIGWICGLPYVKKADHPNPAIKLLAAPVMAGERYQQKPVYFSDVVTTMEQTAKSFAELGGATWAFNEPNSHSGYNITRYRLAQINAPRNFFGRVIEAGSHENALKLLLKNRIDASAIDSTVLETELRAKPEIANQIRIIEALGPSPIPPYVMRADAPPEVFEAIQTALLEMDTTSLGQEILGKHHMLKFVEVSDQDYDPIREMERFANQKNVIL